MYGLVLLHMVLRLKAVGVSDSSSNDGCFAERSLGCVVLTFALGVTGDSSRDV